MNMDSKEGKLGLSLGLSLDSHHHHHLQLNLMQPCWNNNNNNNQSNSSDRTSSESGRCLVRGMIDVNRMPPSTSEYEEEEEEEEEAAMSSPNSTVSSVVSGKRSERGEPNAQDLDGEEEDAETSRKKLRLTKDQSAVLEQSFKQHNTLNPKQKLALAKQLGLRPRQVEVWYQNRRARTKLKQTEVDCEFLKRCVENLTDENRRLQKEVQELRALKLSPQLYMRMTPPTTLTMCPSCERVAVPSSSATRMGLAHPQAQPQAHIYPWPNPIPLNLLHPHPR